MKISFFFRFAALILLALNSCKSTNNASVTSSAEPTQELELLFIGCVPSIGECRYSCPGRNGQGQPDKNQCQDDLASIACSCPVTNFVAPTPPDETLYDFVGCVPSGSECRYSCNSREIIAFQGSSFCEMRQFACYCKK